MSLKVLVFSAEWCGMCKVTSPIVDRLKTDNPDVDVKVLDFDIEQSLVEEFKVDYVPAIIFLKDGEEVERVGGMPRYKLQQLIDNYKQ